jgi:FixJ family two-component response regulator
MARKRTIVYVIDDDASVRKAFARLLSSEGLDCETFASPEEFFVKPRREKNACIVADIGIPGLAGFDFQQELTGRKISLPVIVVSASDDAQVREHTRKMGAVAFFRKPVDDQALFDAILWAISGHA